MDKIIVNAMEDVAISNGDVRRILHESFDAIFGFFGRKNFERWINKGDLSEHIRKLIIEEFSAEDIEKNPNWAGMNLTNKDHIKYKILTPQVLVHELYHFITNNKDKFGIFLNEGITEYLTYYTNDKNQYTYMPNVELVALLHKVVGDSLIKNYLMGVDDGFKDVLSSYITADGKADRSKLNEFQEALNKYHTYKYSQIAEERNKADEVCRDKEFVIITTAIQNLVVNSIIKKAQSLEFYESGKLDAGLINEVVMDTISATIEVLERYGLPENVPQLLNEIYERSIEGIIKNSHLLVGNNHPNDILDFLKQGVKYIRVENGDIIPRIEMSQSSFQVLLELNEGNKTLKLSEVVIDGMKKEMFQSGLSEYLMKIALIVEKTLPTDQEMDYIIDKQLMNILPSNVDPRMIRDVVKRLVPIAPALYERKAENERNTVESKFIPICKDHFIEKRDNKYFIIYIDKKNNRIVDQELPMYDGKLELSYFGEIGRVTPIFSEEKGERTYNIRLRNTINGIFVQFDDDFKSLGKSGQQRAINGVDGLMEYLAKEEMLEELTRIMGKENFIKMNGDTHFEDEFVIPSVKINFDEFLPKLGRIIANIPIEYRKEIITKYLERMYTKTYSRRISGN